ncbi:hypothetical protein A3A39_04745 [Candidatus Kaiserbacteria bacterium RIFCSPLOWO2_01_FULL_54_13]|uniref:MazF family transcriptional regulator n=1 Tax=Candidatus Kaiserbacteria bacterium RIFCSPLOWO2_01_FULL_54_13 TaxID=1798512 RepID=A0A1F6F1X3_9BACT|nr:MAG: hypothetical protein A3A39_04745 [Candidatus Kaiserbacteria bacterium RIFCSPLOWO2_01_FULL_54_13]
MPRKGAIVLVAFPFTDLSGEKLRPALVVGVSRDHLVTLFITSRLTGERRWHVPIAASTESGLVVASFVRCDKVASFDIRIVAGEIGRAGGLVVRAVDVKLRKLLRL